MARDPLQLLTLGRAAALLGVHRRTIDRMIAAGDLQVFKWHTTRRVYRSELERFIKAHTTRTRRTSARMSASASAPAPQPEAPRDDAPKPPVASTARPRSIVILEDDENIRRFLSFALMAEGYAVRQCASYDELIEECADEMPDVVITDGWGSSTTHLDPTEREAIAELARRCPTILTTGRDWAQRVDPSELGLVAIFPKPYVLEDVVATLRTLEMKSAVARP